MKWNTIFILILCAYLASKVRGDHDELSRMAAHAWDSESTALAKDPDCQKCFAGFEPSCQSDDNKVSLTYFKKFISNLFNRKKLKFDESHELYKRAVVFSILPAELEKLENLRDPRDLDEILTEIFSRARTIESVDPGQGESGHIVYLIWDIVKDLLLLLKTSEIRFLVIVMIVVLLAAFIHRRYRVKIISIILVVLFVSGYLVTYLECNRKLEVEEMLEKLQEQNTVKTNWFSRFNWFANTAQPILEKSSKINLGFCRPDHVLILYGNELFFKHFEFLSHKFASTVAVLNASFTFPFNLFVIPSMLFMLVFVLYLSFKYILSPRAWASLFHRTPNYTHHEHQQLSAGNANNAEDRISGDNLKILLNLFSSPSIVMQSFKTTTVTDAQVLSSGVQNINEQLDAQPIPLNIQNVLKQLGSPVSNSPQTSDSNLSNTSTSDESKSNYEIESDCIINSNVEEKSTKDSVI